jgi:Zn-dependent peptidase ImmA (M78 family)
VWLDGADAQLVRNGSRAVIMVSDRVTDIGALRFGIAHELGHFLLGHPMKSASVLRAINVAFRELTFA